MALEPEALEKADTDGLDATLHWLQTRPGIDTAKDKWLLRLLMARVAGQKGRNELALHLLGELDSVAHFSTLTNAGARLPTGCASTSASSRSISMPTHRWPAPCTKP